MSSSSSLKKTIKINPELFNISKTKKREKKPKAVIAITPNTIKKQLLNKIKEHKNKEINDSKTAAPKSNTFTDEFNDSINYLTSLSKKQKENVENIKKKEVISNKTIKNYQNTNAISYQDLQCHLELPEELKEISSPIIDTPMVIKQNPNDIPYGCLKGGLKPTFRTWKTSTQKNIIEPVIISNKLDIPVVLNERERKLELLKIKMKQEEQKIILETPIHETPTTIIEPIIEPIVEPIKEMPIDPISLIDTTILNTKLEVSNELKKELEKKELETPKLIKRTIKKQYTLGKSKIYRTVSILIKDQNTRKNILNAQRELKRTSVNDAKKYLKNRGLIKVGSNAPNDVILKTYESAVLAGEITNNNKETILHNFLNDTL